MRRVSISVEEPRQIVEFIKYWNIELGLDAEVVVEPLETFDFLFNGETESGELVKVGSERKGIETDFFESIYNNRLFQQLKRMITLADHASVVQVAGSIQMLAPHQAKTLSTFMAQSTALGVPVLVYRDARNLCHGFIQYCLAESHVIFPKFHLLANPVKKDDETFIKMLKQFPGCGDDKAEFLGSRYKGPLTLAGVRIPEDSIDELVDKCAKRISSDLREGKELKRKPKKNLKVADDLAGWLFETR